MRRVDVAIRAGLTAGAVAMAVALYAANVWLGNLNQDEGWYLYAARMVRKGHRLYQDFHFSQAPVLPHVFALLTPLWDWGGVLGGRLLNAAFGLAGAVLAGALAARLASRPFRYAAAWTAFLLTAGNVYHSYFTSIVKTYSLTAFFLTGGWLALSLCAGPWGLLSAAIGGVLLALAAGTRLSVGLALVFGGLYLLWERRRINRWSWLVFGLTGTATLVVVYLPIMVRAAEAFLFGMGLHIARAASADGSIWLLRGGSLSRLARGYFPMLALGVAGLVIWYLAVLASRHPQERQGVGRLLGLISATTACIGLLHWMPPFPYDDYQVPLGPLAAVVVSSLFWAAMASCAGGKEGPAPRMTSAVMAGLLLLAAVAAVSSPINQEWFVIGQDRFWVRTKPRSDLARLREAAEWVRQHCPPDKPLLTQDAYLAVQAQRSVPRGFEMGPFGYYPELPTEQALRFRVLNRELLREALSSGEAPVAAFSGYGMALAAPAMTPVPDAERNSFFALLEQKYERAAVVPYFGQNHTELILWRRKTPPPAHVRPQVIEPMETAGAGS